MLGLPVCGEPVLANILAGAWLNTLVFIERIMVSLSATDPMLGSNSDIQAPDWPFWRNRLGLAKSFGRSLEKVFMKANRLPLTKDSGMGCPWRRLRSGLRSNRSNWLGPPAMKR